MLRKLGVAHLKVLLIYLTVVTILRWEFPHSFGALFSLVYIPVVFFAVTSSSGLFGKGVALGVMVHLLHDIWRDQLKNPSELNSWLFWMVSRDVTLEAQKIFVWVLTAAFGMVSLILL